MVAVGAVGAVGAAVSGAVGRLGGVGIGDLCVLRGRGVAANDATESVGSSDCSFAGVDQADEGHGSSEEVLKVLENKSRCSLFSTSYAGVVNISNSASEGVLEFVCNAIVEFCKGVELITDLVASGAADGGSDDTGLINDRSEVCGTSVEISRSGKSRYKVVTVKSGLAGELSELNGARAW